MSIASPKNVISILMNDGSASYSGFDMVTYAVAMADKENVKIAHTKGFGGWSSSGKDENIISVPNFLYDSKMTESLFYSIKGFFDHEIARLIFPDGYKFLVKNDFERMMCNIFLDFKVNRLLQKKYPGVWKGFFYLTKTTVLMAGGEEGIIKDINVGNFDSYLKYIYYYFNGYKYENLQDIVNLEVVKNCQEILIPLIDEHISRKDECIYECFLHFMEEIKIMQEIKKLIPISEGSFSQPGSDYREGSYDDSSGNGNPSKTSIGDISEGSEGSFSQPGSGYEEGSYDDFSGNGNPSKTSIGGISEGSEGSFSQPGSGYGEGSYGDDFSGNGNPSKTSIGDISEGMDKLLSNIRHIMKRDYGSSEEVKPYVDRVVDCTKYDSFGRGGPLFPAVMEVSKKNVSSAYTKFNSVLFSTKHAFNVESYEGKFNSRRVTRLVTSFAPRVYTHKVQHSVKNYDISILLDCSGSMWHIRNANLKTEAYNANAYLKTKAYNALVMFTTIAKALSKVQGINFELLGFNSGNNHNQGLTLFLYEVKKFTEPFVENSIYRFIRAWGDGPSTNFDAGAVTLAASRLKKYNAQTGNNNLLIVISDGDPNCLISRDPALLKKTINILSKEVNIFGVGLEARGIGKFYPNSKNFDSGDLYQGVFDAIVDYIRRGK
jgi:hypothetical protein